ncbi:3-oxoacyl-(acyl-carrier-protein) synthase/malonyl CoA-acyl carrier protein transacylase/phosphopantetheinyl transferase [Pedobacter cryoconitis]|uniref:3-oxoacyl-(Acyl-carrier-protein) synthase/malonyl CoA-acyl carrier protein transacylase/phosphopantetheinyl transferase n=1 Tax=Pedobacter cryoconitis TaxID=188932 RepID=A0A7W8ZNM1_9SPHI|nr:type I polyketide synthase [Pedobacter cryoconitis]MBB5637332.1 3-oxoacyl-(acyl-carrier-protein) synthase/malonyl CoA-acyl carrier protein transacylase/phosphopantetheinyl transferase [Pedobacter cryoconitis]
MKKTDVAVVGMSCIFPGAGDLDTFWKNIINKVDSTQVVPPDRIDPVHFDKQQTGVDRFYCNRGGFIPEYNFDPQRFGILPVAVNGTEPDHLLTLDLVYRALEDAGVFQKNTSLEKTGIIIGKGNYAGPGATRAIEIVRTGEQIAAVLKDLLPHLETADIEKVKHEFQARKGRFGPDTAMGLIPNLVASLVANRLNLGGVAFTLDAACASSLIAIDHAVQELNSGRCNMVIAGGVHVGQNAAFWSIFSNLGALSKQEKIKPFDQSADGLIIGEGCGFVVLKRLEDAVKDKDRIYAVIKGVGVSSDGSGTSVMSPSVKGQLRAITQAWENSGVLPATIGYIEAHGTGTPLGDKTELETLTQFFGADDQLLRAGIGTVKSNIGHAMPAAGIAGLIKTCLALYHDILPPTLHCENPLAQLEKTRFLAVQEPLNWEKTGLPKVAGVNAFGFGGINAHVVLEGFTAPKKDGVLLLARPSLKALTEALENHDYSTGTGNYRIAVFDPTPERIKKAIKIASKDNPWRNKQDIWYTNEPLLSNGGKIAFVFPGLDGLAGGEINSVADYFEIATDQHIKADGLLSEALKTLGKSSVLDIALKQLGVQPDMNAGHSLGEWLAARSSELAEESSVLQLLKVLNPETFELKDSRFIAVGCGIEQLLPIIADINDVYLSNDNCPQQVILCGSKDALEELTPILKAKQIFHQVLPFQSGFHSPFIADKLEVILEGMKDMQFRKTTTPLWSATTLELYPEGFEAIRHLSAEHLIKPVRFRELTEKLYEQGARVFIQIGSGGLVGFIEDTLKGKNFSTISSNVPVRSGIAQLQRVLAALFVEGKEAGMNFIGKIGSGPALKNKGIRLELGLPTISGLSTLKELTQPSYTRPKPLVYAKELLEDVADPVMQAFNENMLEMVNMQAEMQQLFKNRIIQPANYAIPAVRSSPVAYETLRSAPVRIPFSKQLDITLENCPYLKDHALLRQPKDWHCVDDMDPVIPMTMIFELFAEIAEEQSPGEQVQKILNIKVFQWMNVIKPFRETVTGEWKDQQRVYLNLERFANAEVILSAKLGIAEHQVFDIGKVLDIQRSPEQIYENHMFHGPGYQGIKSLKAVGEKGITGIIESGAGKGSLLDNAGQLFGLWLQLILTKDRIAFPVKIQEIEFFENMHDQQGEFECTCVLTEMNGEFATGNFIIKRDNRVWAIISGWQNRRLEIDDALWSVSMSPLHNRLSKEIAPGIFMFHNAYSRVVSWDFILKRYFNQEEKKYHNSLLPNKRKAWMISRVAVKDAVRNLLNIEKQHACYPITFEIKSDERQKPYPHGGQTAGIHVSLAHKGTDAVGVARLDRPVGIDIESIEDRSTGFFDLAFDDTEIVLLQGRDKAEWATRFWTAKEAYGKYLGKGLQGNPKAYIVEEIRGEELRIKDIFIKTIKHHNYIIGWTQ